MDRLKIRLMGDWQKTLRTFSRLGPEIKEASIKAQFKVSKEIEKAVKKHLLYQDIPGWAPLNQKYLQRKKNKGRDGRTLISLGTYYHAITTWQIGNQNTVIVGVKTGIYTKDLRGRNSKLDVAKIAILHEFSTSSKLPRRPLWNPTIQEFGGPIGIRNSIQKSFIGILRKKGIPIKKYQNIQWQ